MYLNKSQKSSLSTHGIKELIFTEVSFSILDLQEHIYVALFDENFKPFEFMYKMYKSI